MTIVKLLTWDLSLRFGFIVNNLCYLCAIHFCNICVFHPWTTYGQWFLDPPGIKPWSLQLAFTLLYLTRPSFQPHLSLITFLHFMLWSICTTVHPEQVPITCLSCLISIEFATSSPLSMENSVHPLRRAWSSSPAWYNYSWSESWHGLICLLYLIYSLVCNVLLLVYLC